MHNFSKDFTRNRTPQSEAIPGTVANSAGGHSFPVDDWMRLDRFLVLGSEGGSYYASQQKLTRENAKGAIRCLAADPVRTVDRVVEISESGRAPKQDPAIFVLGLAASAEGATGEAARREAFKAVSRVCRTGTHLFQFVQAVDGLRGWGRGLRRAVSSWYTDKSVDKLAYQIVKYRNRAGFTHRDVLRLAHPLTSNAALANLFDWTCGRAPKGELPAVVRAFQAVQDPDVTKRAVIEAIREYDLPWEALPTEMLKEVDVNRVLLERMPIGAMTRQLARLTANGTLVALSDEVARVRAKLGDADAIRRARLHPLSLLLALKTYAQGRGDKGSLTWSPLGEITEALDAAFYAAFKSVEPTNKRLVLALDVSGSMAGGSVAGSSLTPRDASAAMALVTAATEPRHQIVGFTGGIGSRFLGMRSDSSDVSGLTPLAIGPRMRLDDAVRKVSNLPFGSTDCSLPMRWALKTGVKADAFVVYTDSETWAGPVHPVEALREYRRKTGIPAKMVVVGLVSNGFTVADPDDAGMLDVVGFDAAAPALIADFIRG